MESEGDNLRGGCGEVNTRGWSWRERIRGGGVGGEEVEVAESEGENQRGLDVENLRGGCGGGRSRRVRS